MLYRAAVMNTPPCRRRHRCRPVARGLRFDVSDAVARRDRDRRTDRIYADHPVRRAQRRRADRRSVISGRRRILAADQRRGNGLAHAVICARDAKRAAGGPRRLPSRVVRDRRLRGPGRPRPARRRLGDGAPRIQRTQLREFMAGGAGAGVRGGQGRTYLQLGYHPLDVPTLHLVVANLRNVTDAPTEIELVPVYTSADASQPSLTMPSVISLEPRSGPKKPRKATPEEVVSTTFTRATLPDGTAPDHWGFRVTGCGSGGPTWIDVTARIGSEEPVELGQCSESSFSTWCRLGRCRLKGRRSPCSWPAARRSPTSRWPSSSGAATATDLATSRWTLADAGVQRGGQSPRRRAAARTCPRPCPRSRSLLGAKSRLPGRRRRIDVRIGSGA